jgi:hypothetical protein
VTGKPEGIVQKPFRRLNGTAEFVLFPFFTRREFEPFPMASFARWTAEGGCPYAGDGGCPYAGGVTLDPL